MLHFVVHNAREHQSENYDGGPIEFGRGPRRGNVKRVMIQDPYVSKDHVRIEQLPTGELCIENLSAKQPITTATGAVAPGASVTARAPVRLGVGDSFIDVELAIPDEIEPDALLTVNSPFFTFAQDERAPRNILDEAPTPEVLMQWFEAVMAVQRTPASSPEFYRQTARAMVDLVNLDSGLIILRKWDAWNVHERAFRDEGPTGREFSHTILDRVYKERRTFYQARVSASQSDSLHNTGSVVASPIFDASNQVIGVLYGAKKRGPRARELGKVEAQLVQVLATAVSAGIIRMDQENQSLKLRAAAEAAQAADRTKSQFLANMSHELRTPLNAIIGYGEMLQEEARDLELGPTFVGDLEKITGAGKHLLMLINDILDLSKIEAGKMTLLLESFDLGPLIKDVVSTVDPLVKKNGNSLVVEVPENVGGMHADITRIRQCLYNLLSNASKFTEKGTVTLTVSRQQEQGREWLRFAVRDSGIGMTADQIKNLFERFRQADSGTTKKYGGTGLGLAITQRFCRMMGGDVQVRSEPEKGSTFTLVIPARVEKAFEPTDVHKVPAFSD